MPTDDPFALAVTAAEAVASATGVERHDVAVVLGSGWGPAIDELGDTVAEVPVTANGMIRVRSGSGPDSRSPETVTSLGSPHKLRVRSETSPPLALTMSR